MAFWKSKIVMESSVDKTTDIIMSEKRIASKYLFGIKFAEFEIERDTTAYEGEPIKQSNTLGFKSKK